jgi:uncharacterized protein
MQGIFLDNKFKKNYLHALNLQGACMGMKVDKILNLGDGEHHFEYTATAKEIGLESKDFEGHDTFDRPITANVFLNKSNHVYHVKLRVHAEAHFLCDRCLEDVQRRIEGSFEIIFSDLMSAAESAHEETEMRRLDTKKVNEIVLDKDVGDTLTLALPNKVLCKDDCKGLCDQCGADLNHTVCEHAVAVMSH